MDRIDLEKIVKDLVGLEKILASQDTAIVAYQDKKWINERSKTEVEFDDEQQPSYEQELTNLRVS